ncbi:MAG: stage III sporulation protein SpoIIIAB [Bacillota bacterium]|nr:stage III sporulation protein SpoIIIAB [Bacillota bacterium]
MLKLTGALLIIGACGLLGNDIARAYAQRPRLLRSLQTALQLLETEINYGATPLPAALKLVATAGDPQIAPFFLSVRALLLEPGGKGLVEAWKRGLEELKYYTVLTERDLEPLAALGGILGGSDRQDQVKHLQLAREQLKGAEKGAREACSKIERMWRYLGFLLGTMLVLTLY